MTDLIGLCTKCHHLVHSGLLVIERNDTDGTLTVRRPAGHSRIGNRTTVPNAWQQRHDCAA